MRYLILGAGLVGTGLARQLRAEGHQVVGTTTTPAKVDKLKENFDDVRVVEGGDREAIRDALADCDGLVVTVGPRLVYVEADREPVYRAALVDTAESVVWAVKESGLTGPVIVTSSNAVYGDAQNDRDMVTEDGPLTDADSASPRNFKLMEQTYLDGLPDQVCVYRCTEIYSDDEAPLADQLRGAHEHMGGNLPFAGDALLYRTHVTDVIRAIEHALEKKLSGVYNLASATVPITNQERFDSVSESIGMPPFNYLGEIKAPSKPLSVERLAATGFSLDA